MGPEKIPVSGRSMLNDYVSLIFSCLQYCVSLFCYFWWLITVYSSPQQVERVLGEI